MILANDEGVAGRSARALVHRARLRGSPLAGCGETATRVAVNSSGLAQAAGCVKFAGSRGRDVFLVRAGSGVTWHFGANGSDRPRPALQRVAESRAPEEGKEAYGIPEPPRPASQSRMRRAVKPRILMSYE